MMRVSVRRGRLVVVVLWQVSFLSAGQLTVSHLLLHQLGIKLPIATGRRRINADAKAKVASYFALARFEE